MVLLHNNRFAIFGILLYLLLHNLLKGGTINNTNYSRVESIVHKTCATVFSVMRRDYVEVMQNYPAGSTETNVFVMKWSCEKENLEWEKFFKHVAALGRLTQKECGNYAESWEELGKTPEWKGCSKPKGHEGNCLDGA